MAINRFTPYFILILPTLFGCFTQKPSLKKNYKKDIVKRILIAGINKKVNLFKGVFDFTPCAKLLLKHLSFTIKKGDGVLDITAEAGYASLAAAQYGAKKVIATDINPLAIENIRYNKKKLNFTNIISERLINHTAVPLAYDKIKNDDTFDIILFKEPCGIKPPQIKDNIQYTQFKKKIFRSFLDGLKNHLKPKGTALILTDQPHSFVQKQAEDVGIALNFLPNTENCGIYFYAK